MSDQIPSGFSGSEVIGRGGFAIVYLALQDAVNREVAIKVMDDANVSEDVQRRFRRECVAVGSLSWHPHIAQVFDAGVNNTGHNYMVLEYMPNGSLAERVEDGPLDEATSLEYMVQIADAVHAAHTEGVLHRDIKPDNILLDRLGRAKLADFGIADMRDGTKTATGTITATILYAAPEVLGGERATATSDVYGLSATLHTLLAGKAPFETDTKLDLIALIGRIVSADPADLRRFDVTEGTAEVVEQNLSKTPETRHQTALEFGRALQEAQDAAGFRVTPMPFADRRIQETAKSIPSADPRETSDVPAPAADQANAAAITGDFEPPVTSEPLTGEQRLAATSSEALPLITPPVEPEPASPPVSAASPQAVEPTTPPEDPAAESPPAAPASAAPAPEAQPATPATPAPDSHAPSSPPPASIQSPVATGAPSEASAHQTRVGAAPLPAAALGGSGLAPPAEKKSRAGALVALLAVLIAAGAGAFFVLNNSGDDGDDPVATGPIATTEATEPTVEATAIPAAAGATLDDLVSPDDAEPAEPTVAPTLPEPTPSVRAATGLGIDIAANSNMVSADCASFDTFASFAASPTCHRITVPENWSDPGNSGEVSLAVAVFEATDGSSNRPPVVYFAGGPGTHALSLASVETFFDPVFRPVLADHDVIIFDQRGTGNSNPKLDCTEYNDIGGEEVVALIRATDNCIDRLSAAGIQLGQYSGVATAHDAEAIRQALGIGSWQLFGQSYGTRIGLTYSRLYPDNVDAMVLDAVRPPDYNITASRAPDFERSMELVFQTCKADDICAETYPNLRQRFFDMTEQLNNQPINVDYSDAVTGEAKSQSISDTEFLLFTHSALYAPSTIWAIPAMIRELETGGATVLAQFIQQTDFGLNFVTAGQLIIVNCNDDILYEDPGDIVAQRPDEPIYARIANSPTSGFSFEDCDSLDRDHLDPIENEVVTSDVPTLLLGGRFDPVLPPPAVLSTASELSNSTTVVFPWESHGVSQNPCGITLITEYLNNPTGQLDTSCVANQPQVTFG